MSNYVRALVAVPVVLVVAMLMTAGTASAAPAGCTGIQSSTGTVCVDLDARSNTDVQSFGGSFLSGTYVVRPKLIAELFDINGKVAMTAVQEWQNDRISESVTRAVNRSYEVPFNKVCATVYEAGEKLGTACTAIRSAH